MGKKLRVGVIGIGFAWDRLHEPAFAKLKDQYEIAAICNKTIDKAQGAAQGLGLAPENVYSDYRELLKRSDLDVVDVLVPITENYEVAKDVILAGKNLIAEKPFASTPEAARELIQLKNEKGVTVMVAENFRYDECSRILKDIITSGQIGEVFQVIYNKGADFEKDMTGDTFAAKEWRQHPGYYGGTFLDGGIHDIALLRYLFGDVENVYALGRAQQEEYCPYLAISTMLKFKNNVMCHYSYFSQGAELQKPPVGFRMFGTCGDVYMQSTECGIININYKDGRRDTVNFTPAMGYYNELLDYYNGSVVSTPEKELGDITLIFDILKSIEDGTCKDCTTK